jgi:hypothetical protein
MAIGGPKLDVSLGDPCVELPDLVLLNVLVDFWNTQAHYA